MNNNCVLGLLNDEEKQRKYTMSNDMSEHAKSRVDRANLVGKSAKPLFYFEIYRRGTGSRQIHCLLEDATLLVFNRKTELLITVIILDNNTLNKYLQSIEDVINYNDRDILQKCARLNVKTKAHKVGKKSKLTPETFEDYKRRKTAILNINN